MRINFHRSARSTPDAIDGFKVPYAAAKRNAPKWRWRLILLAVLSPAILLAYGALQSMLTLSANGSVFLEPHEVRAPAGGRVAAIVVRLGAEVREGDLVVRLEDPELDAALVVARQASAEVAPRVSARERSLLLEELALHERALQTQQQRAQAMAQLVQEGAATAAELRETQFAADQAMAAVLRVRQQIPTTHASVDATSAQDERTRNEVNRMLAKRERLMIRAPQSGRVIDVLTSEGQFVAAGEPLLLLGRVGDPQVIAYVSPEIAPKLSVGARATIKFPDGTKAQASVAEQPMLTRRMPADLVDQFGRRPMTVVLHLQADRQWPAGQRIHGLPVTVRFHYAWEGMLGAGEELGIGE